MTLDETRALLIPLALAVRADFDGPTQRAYHRQLEAVPTGLAQAAVADLEQTGKHAAERKRRQLVAANPYTGCADCEDQRGYRTVLGRGGQKVVEPCPCKARWLEQLGSAGIREPLGALPSEDGAGGDQVYPTLEQLPAPLRTQIQQAANRKALR